MAATKSQQLNSNLDGTISRDSEVQMSDSGSKRGATMTGLTLAAFGGVTNNLIVYLIGKFNVKSIDAAQISNVVSGCSNLFPVLGAIIADSFLGSFSVISISSFLSLLGMIFLLLTATLDLLRPPPCGNGSVLCVAPSKIQFAVLYAALALACIGIGGTRFTIATMGANQLDEPKDHGIFFNWFFFTFYTSIVISSTVIVYVEDNVGWTMGFGLCVAANVIGVAIFVLGNRYYRHIKPKGSPFVDLARVIVAAIRKRKVLLSSRSEDYYNEHDGVTSMMPTAPTKSFKCLNRAALKTEEDTQLEGKITRSWRLCSVKQVEDLKTLIRIFPLWSTSILLSTTIGIQSSLVVLQTLSMDRHIGPHFKIPAGSILVTVFISTSITLTIIDRFLCPTWQKLTRQSPTPLQRIGLGHVLNVLSMAVSAIVESKRLDIARAHHVQDQPGSTVPMLALWLLPPLVIVGIGEAFHFPGQVALYYQEFPVSLRSTSTAMIAMIIGIGFYLSTALIDLVRRVTGWLPDDINNGRLDNVYWTLTVVGVLNLGYYLVCARLYKYRNVENVEDDNSSSYK
ncbi:protein NRT1/ PTR FAMILY 2.6-like isoform X2 [Cornus florida]|uniref:protein NRT1/ PTR FAMILY 2.6-like isoform X2 n=1 Tax=Cornus florida TaxID=4283 RepID=UPI0028A0467A|nr:protein NRT1/ PTR FAMILY 2.6-like isoform X2 [Cornus florida]